MVDITNKTWRHRHSRKCVVMNNSSLDPDDYPWDGKLNLSALQEMRRGRAAATQFCSNFRCSIFVVSFIERCYPLLSSLRQGGVDVHPSTPCGWSDERTRKKPEPRERA